MPPPALRAWQRQELRCPEDVTELRTLHACPGMPAQVYIPNEDISLYALARKWIQNLPEEEQHPPEQVCTVLAFTAC